MLIPSRRFPSGVQSDAISIDLCRPWTAAGRLLGRLGGSRARIDVAVLGFNRSMRYGRKVPRTSGIAVQRKVLERMPRSFRGECTRRAGYAALLAAISLQR